MRAAILPASGLDTLEVRDDVVLKSDLAPRQVRVRVRATGVCHSDLAAMAGGMPLRTPALLGHEAAGEVVEVGPLVQDVEPGDHIIVSAVPPCGRCPNCLRGQGSMCRNFASMFRAVPHHRVSGKDLYAFCNVGSFAEEIVLPEESAIRIDRDVPFDIASIVGCAVATGVGAVINAARVEPGALVLVIGCGGVGISVIQAARLVGALVVAVDRTPEKLGMARENGAAYAVTADELDELGRSLHGGEGFDYAFEAIGRADTIRAGYDAVRRGGNLLVLGIGRPDEAVPLNAYELAWSGKTITGSTYGSGDPRRDFPKIIDLWRAGRLDLERLVSTRVALQDINTSLEAVRAGAGIRHVVLL
jgi:S-(hydroxymethyl)glutathione dehydrogenase / alcohol dehydrogenase